MCPSWLGVVGFYEGAEFLPGDDLFHLGQKLLPPCGFFLLLEGHGVGKALLALHAGSAPSEDGMVEQKAGMGKPRLSQPYFTRSRSLSGGLFQRFLKLKGPLGPFFAEEVGVYYYKGKRSWKGLKECTRSGF